MASDSAVVPSINLELEEFFRQLADFGNALLDPPASKMELLVLLEEFGLFLSRICQGEEEVIPALGPSKKALIANKLLNHADTDVQIAVLCCISEITRITAPQWPYEDEEMKEFFVLLVQSLGRLLSMHESCSAKVTSILETMAIVRSCVMMLDLKMEGSILEMFGHFLTTIEPSPVLLSYMVTIMTLLIGEYYEEGSVPVDLLSILLTSVKNDKKDVLPTAWALGKQILQESDKHIRASLAKAVESLEIDVNDYAEIVASICNKEAQVEKMVDQEPASDSAGPEQIDRLVDTPSKSVENNCTAQDTDNGISSEQNTLKTLQFSDQIILSNLTDNATSKRDDGLLKDENSLKDLDSGPIEVQKTTDLKTISEAENVNVMVLQEQNHDVEDNHGVQNMDHNISSEQNTSTTLQFGNQTSQSPLTDDVTSRSDIGSLKDENFLKEQISGAMDLETISEAENVNAAKAVPQENNHCVEAPGKRQRKPNSLIKLDEGYRFTKMTGETGNPKLSCGRRKSNRLSDRKSNAVSLGSQGFPDENLCSKGTLKKDGHRVNQDDAEQKQASLPPQVVHAKQRRGESAIPADCDEESALEKFEVLASHLTNKPAPKSQRKRKWSSSKREASRMIYGEKLVGRKIKVWWPREQQYYEGSVDSFDRSTTMHKVIYDYGETETHNLLVEVWQLVRNRRKSSVGPSSKKRKENNDGEAIPEVARASVEQVGN